jgi:hemerythrin-like domain-containing protein
LQEKLSAYEHENAANSSQITALLEERNSLRTYIRQIEQKNDDLEQANRQINDSVIHFESLLNQALEKNALLEIEMEEKSELQEKLQRLMDEARGEYNVLIQSRNR